MPKKPPREIKPNKEKNKDKEAGGWCTDDIAFDQEGALYIRNQTLARELQSLMDAWGGMCTIVRDKFPEETTGSGGPGEGNKMNMMCACAPEP